MPHASHPVSEWTSRSTRPPLRADARRGPRRVRRAGDRARTRCERETQRRLHRRRGPRRGQSQGDQKAGENIVALCDVDAQPAGQGGPEKFPQAKTYRDFRKMLDEQKDIDAVVVSTPDHTHAVAAHGRDASWASTSIARSRSPTRSTRPGCCAEAAREAEGRHPDGQPGPLQRGHRRGRRADPRRRDRRRSREVHVWTNRPIWPQGIDRPDGHAAGPGDARLGPLARPRAERPYNPAYHPFKWRGWWDFGTGALGDMGCHIIDPAFWALDLRAPDERRGRELGRAAQPRDRARLVDRPLRVPGAGRPARR